MMAQLTISEITATIKDAINSSISSSAVHLPPARESASSISYFSAILWFSSWVFFKTVGIIVYYIPAFILSILSANFSITLSFSSLLLILAFVLGITYTVVRYRLLTGYSRLPSEPTRKVPKMDVLLTSRDDDAKSRFSSYLDEFLTAIKIFGYLEKPVFHELTKNMTTQKLEANEAILLSDNLGFSVVVEGTVKVYSKVHNNSDDSEEHFDFGSENSDEDVYLFNGQRYQLLNEVKSGAPLSSLLSTLTLFTHEPKEIQVTTPKRNSANAQVFKTLYDIKNQSVSPEYLTNMTTDTHTGDSSPDVATSKLESTVPSKTTESTLVDEKFPEVIAKASTDATIAIIPSSAFKRLLKKHPRASSHIVQMVLTRLYRVTFQTAHDYLGLTREIFSAEIKLNRMAKYELPSYLHDGVIQKFRETWAANLDDSDFNSLQNGKSSQVTSRRSSFSKNNSTPVPSLQGTGTGSAFESRSNSNTTSLIMGSIESDIVSLPKKISKMKTSRPRMLKTASRHVVLDARNSSNPGDLLSSVPLSRRGLSYQSASFVNLLDKEEIRKRTFSAEEETEDTALRIALVESMFKLLGVTKEALKPAGSDLSSGFSSSTDLSSMGSPLQQAVGNAGLYNTYNSLNTGFRKRLLSQSSEKFFFETASNEDEDSLSSIGGVTRNSFDFDFIIREFASCLEILCIKKNSTVIEQDKSNNGLYYVVDGLLEVGYKDNNGNQKNLYTVKPGGLAGYIGSLSGYRSFVTVSAKTDTYVGFVPKESFQKLVDKFYTLQLPIAKGLTGLLTKQILQMDFALEWVHTQAGNTLCSQNELANGIHIVLNGRFRSIREEKKKGHNNEADATVLGEHGQGESIGEVEVLTATKRNSTLIAVRDSETARIPRTLFEMLALQNPSIMIKVSRIVANKMAKINQSMRTQNNNLSVKSVSSSGSSFSGNYRTITILPVTYGLPVEEFAAKLVSALKSMDRSVISLNQASTLNYLGKHAFDKLAKLKESGYFAYLEERYETVIYVTDTPVKSNWTRTCISQGDCILLIADALAEPDVGDYERLLLKMRTTARTELCLVHPERFVEPGSTNKWLKNRMWVQSHHHIQMEINRNANKKLDHHFNIFPSKIADIGSRVQSILRDDIFRRNSISAPYYEPAQAHKSDFLRLGRILSNKAIGLVLGGGGARGLSHVGVVLALEKHGIPIDLIGGTSIGSFVGGLYAKDYDIVPIYGRVKKFSSRISSLWRMALDLTYPVTSYITGYEFNRGIWKAFGDSRIEDFWIKYFVNSTNITNSTMDVHEMGYSWRYIRASMSLAGLLPPITDNGSMLLDGGYIDNLPVSEMKSRGADIIFAVDVGSIDDRAPMSYGDTLSGFWVLVNRWNPFSKHPNVPNMAEIQMRLAYVSSVNALEIAKQTPGVMYLRPPIENYATLEFSKFEEIYHVGAAYADNLFTEWENNGTMPVIPGITKHKSEERIKYHRRNSI